MKKNSIYLIIGLCFLGIAISTVLLGTLRNEYIVKLFKDNQPLAKLALLPVNAVYIYYFSKLMVGYSKKHNYAINFTMVGVVLTLSAICLEFVIGYFGENNTIAELLNEYNIFVGNTWPFVLLMIMLFPMIIYRRMKNVER